MNHSYAYINHSKSSHKLFIRSHKSFIRLHKSFIRLHKSFIRSISRIVSLGRLWFQRDFDSVKVSGIYLQTNVKAKKVHTCSNTSIVAVFPTATSTQDRLSTSLIVTSALALINACTDSVAPSPAAKKRGVRRSLSRGSTEAPYNICTISVKNLIFLRTVTPSVSAHTFCA